MNLTMRKNPYIIAYCNLKSQQVTKGRAGRWLDRQAHLSIPLPNFAKDPGSAHDYDEHFASGFPEIRRR